MSATVTIPIAGFKDVYEVPAVEKALQDLAPSANEALRAIYATSGEAIIVPKRLSAQVAA